jgi:hypothetical protein
MSRLQVLVALLCAVPACSSQDEVVVEPLASASTVSRLWILNQAGDPALADFFRCVLDDADWNDLATAYPGAAALTLGAQVIAQPDKSGHYPCTANVGSQAYYQCAVDTGKFDVAPNDVLLVVRPDGSIGGLDNANSTDPTKTMVVQNRSTHAQVTLNAAHVGNATSVAASEQLMFVYAAHEVFEAQTDGISADCCDGETASGGPVPYCPACGPFQNGDGSYALCGQYSAPGGSWGIATLVCPSGRSYRYQQVSPPGAPRYGSPEFNGTCNSLTLKPGAWSCGDSAWNGHQYWTCSGGALHECDASGHPLYRSCGGLGCHANPSGVDDQCFQPSPGWSCAASRGSDGKQYLTCASDGDVHACQGATPVELACPHGCIVNPPNSDDACR